jgi:hypothetical protein
MSKGRQPVALAAGYLDAYNPAQPRNQYIVVVTDGWTIICYDWQLELQWERTIEADVSHSFLHEIAIMITAHAMQEGDTGSIVVGGRLQRKKLDQMYNLKRSELRRTTKVPGTNDLDDEDDDEGEDQNLYGISPEINEEHTGEGEHFSFYAFEGMTGKLRWKHEEVDFHEEAHPSDMLHPQHAVHKGEIDWRNFRYSLLHSMPHQWTMREDTFFGLAHYERRRPGKDRQEFMEQRVQYAVPATHISGLRYAGIQPHDASEHVKKPNVIVAHLRDGIEVIHLFSGRTICRLSLKRGIVHADVNADGVIDHVEAVGGMSVALSRTRASHGFKMPKCLMMTVSGIPPTHQLYNGSICEASPFSKLFSSGSRSMGLGLDDASNGDEDVLIAPPTVVRRYDKHDVLFRRQRLSEDLSLQKFGKRFDSVFMINSGIVTSFRSDGLQIWQTKTKSSWNTGDDLYSSASTIAAKQSMHASVSPFRTREGAQKDHTLALGERYLTVLSSSGVIRSESELEEVPVSTPIVADFNNDGWNDVIVVGPAGIYGYTLERHVATKFFTLVVGFAIACLVVVSLLNMQPKSKHQTRAAARRRMLHKAAPE